jgi:hypothetical protein
VLAHDDCKEVERITLNWLEKKKRSRDFSTPFEYTEKRRAEGEGEKVGEKEVVAVGRGPRHMTILPFATWDNKL